ncbi:MAG TPA: polysaccharide deacetylase family protein [Blastocatellia bacterium]|nr:polysaccharide deacetylase family protein [Blastocatellia bacterium]
MIKQSLLNLMRVSGAFGLMRMFSRRQALILTYHRFSADEYDDDGKTPARVFAEQLEYLTAHYDVVPLSQIVERITAREPFPSGLAAVTIDDGYRDAYEVAYPLLRRYGVPASLFVVTEFADRRAWIWTDKARFLTQQAAPQRLTLKIQESELRLELNGATSRRDASERVNSVIKRLPDESKEEVIERLSLALGVAIPQTPPEEFSSVTWDQAREMDANGVEIGSHTLTHPILTNVGDERLRKELSGSKSRLEGVLGHQVDQFCYPNGDNDERVQCEVARAGYRAAVTVVNGLIQRGDDPLTLRRVHTERDFAHFLQSTSGFEQLKNHLRVITSNPTGYELRSGKIE